MNNLIFKIGRRALFSVSPLVSDEMYLKAMYRWCMGKPLSLKNPVTYNEKLQWLKLHSYNPLYTKMVDKITAKEYAASIIGDQYIIPTIDVWDKFDDIDLDSLPNSFVLKTNNGGGNKGVIVCKDKSIFDRSKARKVLERSLKNSIYRNYREWPYKDVQPKIFAEEFMSDDSVFNRNGLTDYKFTCFNGVADNVMVCIDRQDHDTKFYFFSREWELLPLNVRGKNTDPSFKLPKPECMDEMFELASKLSKGIPFLRVDMYCINGTPYFGEATFFPDSGFDANILPETERIFGDKIILEYK